MTSPQSNHRVLLVEDDVRLANLIVDYLKSHGMHVEVERPWRHSINAINQLQARYHTVRHYAAGHGWPHPV